MWIEEDEICEPRCEKYDLPCYFLSERWADKKRKAMMSDAI